MRPRLLAAATALALTLPATLAAQAVHGIVRDSASGAPVAGALVVLVDATGAERARILSSPSGAYALTVPAAGSHVARVLRIGQARWDSDTFALAAGADDQLALAVPPRPFELPEVEVASKNGCRGNPATTADLMALWDGIRAALGATEETMKRGEYRFGTLVWHRRLTPRLHVTASAVDEGSDRRLWPVRSAPAESLIAGGFVQAGTDEYAPTYYAPDTDFLVDDRFIATHCFHLVRGEAEHSGQLGLAFAPVAGRRLPEVEGTLWVDRETRGLVRLDYHFTNLRSWVPRDHVAGGDYEFAPLPTGGWVMRRWNLRAPVAQVAAKGQIGRKTEASLYGYDGTGGEILEVFSRSGESLKHWAGGAEDAGS